jgi:hypothetical protein
MEGKEEELLVMNGRERKGAVGHEWKGKKRSCWS